MMAFPESIIHLLNKCLLGFYFMSGNCKMTNTRTVPNPLEDKILGREKCFSGVVWNVVNWIVNWDEEGLSINYSFKRCGGKREEEVSTVAAGGKLKRNARLLVSFMDMETGATCQLRIRISGRRWLVWEPSGTRSSGEERRMQLMGQVDEEIS